MAARPGARAAVLVGLLGLWPGMASDDAADDAVHEGNARYRAGQYAAAADLYELAAESLPDAAEIRFNQGNAAFKQLHLDRAVDYYTAALDSQSVGLASGARYNLANVRYLQARQAMPALEDARTLVQSAIDSYRGSLALDPERIEARYNLELAYRFLHAIEARRGQGQRPAEARDPQAPDSHGEPLPEQARYQESVREAAPDQRQTQNREAGRTMSPVAETRRAAAPQDLTPEQAEAFLDAYRERARAAQSLRQDARRSRLRDAAAPKSW